MIFWVDLTWWPDARIGWTGPEFYWLNQLLSWVGPTKVTAVIRWSDWARPDRPFCHLKKRFKKKKKKEKRVYGARINTEKISPFQVLLCNMLLYWAS